MGTWWLRAAALTLLLIVGCAAPSRPALRAGGWLGANVLLVTIDTLRQDRVGVYGSTAGLTPTIDGLAAAGVRYTNAFAHAPMTLPSHTAILTGLTPRRSGVRNNTGFRLNEGIPTLATVLKRAGYRTGAFVGAFVLDARFGLARDFDVYDDHMPVAAGPSFHLAQRHASDVVGAAADWLAQPADRPFFAWVHLFDPHAPYEAPSEYRQNRAPYDAEVAYTDSVLGRFLDRLRTAHQLDRTLIIVTADHGESLGEHGETTHGLFAYQSTLAVPFIIAGPGLRPAVDAGPVGHVDILPTVLDLVADGVGAGTPIDGISLARQRRDDRAIGFEALDASLTRGWAPLRGVVQNGWKYIDLPEPELYDLTADPHETQNRIADASHRALLRDALARLESTGQTPAGDRPIDADAAARLRALGYTAGRDSRRLTATVADDPKRLAALNETFNTALTAFDAGRAAEALDGFLAVLRERPDFTTARTSASTVLISQGRAAEAVRLIDQAPPDVRQSPDLQAKLGAAQRAAGDLAGAVRTLESLKQSGMHDLDVDQDLAVAYAATGRVEQSRRLFAEIVARDRAPATAWYNLGLLELQARRPREASAAFDRAVKRDPGYGDAWQGLGAALVSSDRARAIQAWERAVHLLPRDYDLLFNLGMILADTGDAAAARPHLERFIREAPPAHYARDIEQVRRRLNALERGTGR